MLRLLQLLLNVRMKRLQLIRLLLESTILLGVAHNALLQLSNSDDHQTMQSSTTVIHIL